MGLLRFGTAGVRGRIEELTPKEAYEITYKVSTFFGENVVIARDGRNNGKALLNGVEAALLYLGKNIINIGIAPTPTLQYFLEKRGLDLGIVVTASHNPPEWNGLKFFDEENIGLDKERGNKFLDSEVKPEIKPHNLVNYEDANSFHSEALIKYEIGDPKVIVDYGNGVGSLVFSPVLENKRIKYKEINKEIDGNFPGRKSEPTKENIKDLIELVGEGDFDIGIAFDGDADRVVFVDERGNYVDGNQTFAIIAKYLVENNENKKVVSTVASGRAIEDIVKEAGGEVYYVKVGTTYIAQKIKEVNAILGGEEAGGVIYPKEHLGKDGLLTAMLIMNIMYNTGKSLSELVKEIPKYYSYKTKLPIEREKKKVFIERFKEFVEKEFDGKINTIDGVRVDFEEYWFIVRPSGTEDYVRIFVESKDKEKIEKIGEELKQKIIEFIKQLE